jgi:hypothetical protein
VSSLFVPAGRLIPPEVAVYIARPLEKVLVESRRDGLEIPQDVIDTIKGLSEDADRYLNRIKRQRSGIGTSLDTPRTASIEWISVSQAAEILAITDRAVTALCARDNAFHAAQDRPGSPWRVCRASALAKLEGKSCRHHS